MGRKQERIREITEQNLVLFSQMAGSNQSVIIKNTQLHTASTTGSRSFPVQSEIYNPPKYVLCLIDDIRRFMFV